MALTSLLITSCATDDAVQEDSFNETTLSLEGNLEKNADIVAIWLDGDFDSSSQAADDPNYYNIALRMCSIELPELGDRILYVEQAPASRLNAPYKQLIYKIEPADGRIAARVYSIDPALLPRFVGGCKDPESIIIEVDRLKPREGCTIWLEADGEDSYVGGTEGKGCKTDIGDATYTTTKLIIEPLSITTWERGWDADNAQAWGSEDGPYSFDRIN